MHSSMIAWSFTYSPLLLSYTNSEAEIPSVFGRNLQCELVRGVNFREECH
jgi:hypothetical protein